MDEIDEIRKYCLAKGYSKDISEMNLEAQVSEWEKTVNYLAESEYSNRFYLYDYLNDMDGRQILSECLALFPQDPNFELLKRLEAADKILKNITKETETCIWGNENAKKNGYQKSIHWWYFRRPKDADNSWDQIK